MDRIKGGLSEEGVDFQEFGIGVDPRAMGYGGVVSASLIVPNRVFIMDLSAADQQQGPEV